jgi:hypothetical protein
VLLLANERDVKSPILHQLLREWAHEPRTTRPACVEDRWQHALLPKGAQLP